MWTEWVSVVIPPRPSTAYRNGTTFPSAYAELLPFRSPFCQLHGVVSLAHWSRLTFRPAALALGAGSPVRPGPPKPSRLATSTSTATAIRLSGRSERVGPLRL